MPGIGFGNPYTNNRIRDLYLNTPPSLGSMSAPKNTLSSVVASKLAGALRPVVGGRMANKAADLVGYSPVEAASTGFEFGRDLRHKDWLSALGNGISTALNALPDGGAVLGAKGGAMLHSVIAAGPGRRLGKLFHGTNAEFDAIDLAKGGTNQEQFKYPMAFLSSSPEEAAVYGKNVMAFEPSFENPLHIDAYPQRDPFHEWEVQKFTALKRAKDNGHDAIVFDNGSKKLVVALDASKLRRVPHK